MNKSFTSMDNFLGSDDLPKRECPVCGKIFKPAPEHAYYIGKNRRDLCCSWTCMRNNEKNKTTVKIKKSGRHRTAVRVAETGETFSSITECASQLRINYATIYNALMNGWQCNGYHIEAVLEDEVIQNDR